MILVQPQLKRLGEYAALAESEGLGYELLDFAFPGVLLDKKLGEGIMDSYNAQKSPVKSLHGAFIDINVASNDPGMRELSWNRCIDSCECAVKTGAGSVVFHTNYFPVLDDEPYFESWYTANAMFYNELVRTYDLDVYLENCLDLNPKRLAALMSWIDSPRIRVCLDVGHANYSRAPVGDWVDALHPWIGYLHLNDNAGLYDDHLPCGRGTIDWRGLDARLARYKLEPITTIEVSGIENVTESIAFLRENEIYPYRKA